MSNPVPPTPTKQEILTRVAAQILEELERAGAKPTNLIVLVDISKEQFGQFVQEVPNQCIHGFVDKESGKLIPTIEIEETIAGVEVWLQIGPEEEL